MAFIPEFQEYGIYAYLFDESTMNYKRVNIYYCDTEISMKNSSTEATKIKNWLQRPWRVPKY